MDNQPMSQQVLYSEITW